MTKADTKNAPGEKKQHGNPQHAGQHSVGRETTGQGSQQRELARGGSYPPSLFSLSQQDLFGASPFDLMRRFSEEMERVFGDFGLPVRGLSRRSGQAAVWSPAIEAFQREGNLVVRAELPGLNKDDVKIEVTDDGLTISGESKHEHEERGEGFYRCERSHGQFYRLIPLPQDADTDRVRAEFSNGVLEITVPVPTREQRRREIPIGTESGKQSKAASSRQT